MLPTLLSGRIGITPTHLQTAMVCSTRRFADYMNERNGVCLSIFGASNLAPKFWL